MTQIEKTLAEMRRNPQGIRYDDLKKVCDAYFGQPRSNGTSHRVYRTPWQGKPFVNIQPRKDGKAKPYQVKQVLEAIEKATKEQQ